MYFNCNSKNKKIKENELEIIGTTIQNGGIVVFPTETVYGIGADATNDIAVKKIFEAKGRPSDNPLIVHLANKMDIKQYTKNITELEQRLIDEFMPGPFTIILKKNDKISNLVSANLNTVAIRVPNNIIAQKIIKQANRPIAAPSANVSGKPSGTNIADIREELENKVDHIVDEGDTQNGIESTVVKVEGNNIIILRPGSITKEQLEKISNVIVDQNILNQVNKNEKVLSPGMKYKHYAPNTKCILVYFENPNIQISEIKKIIDNNKNITIIGFSEHKDIFKNAKYFIDFGHSNCYNEIAKNIYSAIRKADSTNSDLIIIEGVQRKGIGLAIMNRLFRAASGNILENREEVNKMEKIRGFEVAKGFEDKEINMPIRKTKYSAGYDMEAAEDIIIPSFKKGMNPTLIKTGIKAYMQDDEVLMLYNRSSNPKKKGLILANSVGVVDKDYYGNSDNDGHIMFAFYNIKEEDITIKKGEAIGQAVFQKYFVSDSDSAIGERKGGFGSTN